jgi:hypothetical protein
MPLEDEQKSPYPVFPKDDLSTIKTDTAALISCRCGCHTAHLWMGTDGLSFEIRCSGCSDMKWGCSSTSVSSEMDKSINEIYNSSCLPPGTPNKKRKSFI